MLHRDQIHSWHCFAALIGGYLRVSVPANSERECLFLGGVLLTVGFYFIDSTCYCCLWVLLGVYHSLADTAPVVVLMA